ncbi:conserved hypothetical protein [Echinococcus multilocularis]|uniref:Uncharacterized protein n=1 Tax=Echinococcus multilocularis TaxID=6211 RepID=A0A087VYY5_ECHMU|nr:conserved hypothetical protein [Echinococcus multilocularis]
MNKKGRRKLSGRERAPREHPLHGDTREETLEERIAFLPPLPSALAIQSRALDQDILQLITKEFTRFMEWENMNLEWARTLVKEVESSTNKHKYHSTTSRPWVAFRGCASKMTNPYLVAGSHNEQILREEKEEKDVELIKTNSPKLLTESSETPPLKKPRSRFMNILFDEKSYGLSNLSMQLREMVRKGTITMSKFFYKRPMERVRYRARDCRLSAVLPLQNVPKTNARLLFRMDVEDTIGMAAFAWKKWIHGRLSKRHVIAKSITDSEIRFSVPSDLRSLEDLSVVDYLERNCEIAKQRLVIYETLYSRMKQAVINVSSLKEAALKVIPTTQTENSLNDLISLLDLPEDYVLKVSTFCKCLGLCERLLVPVVRSSNEEDEISIEEAEKWKFQAGPLECLDFWQLSRRLTDLKVDPTLKRLLEKIERQINSQMKDVLVLPYPRRSTENSVERLFKRARRSIQKYEAAKIGPTLRFARH